MNLRGLHIVFLGGILAACALGAPRLALARRPKPPKLSGQVGPSKVNRWPKPLITRYYLVLNLRYDREKLTQRSLQRKRFGKRRRIKRIAGRFLAKLYQGKRLVDVVPFNFPLLAPAENFTRTGHRIARRMEANLRTATRLKVPWKRSITRIEIHDIGTARRWKINLRSLRPKPRPKPRPKTPPKPRPAPKP